MNIFDDEINEPVILPLFAACDGIQFYGHPPTERRPWSPKPTRYTIRAGVYPTGNGALVIMEGGQAECKLTINLVINNKDLLADQFCVKNSEIAALERYVLDIGVFCKTQDWIEHELGDPRWAQTPPRHFAAVWQFAYCTQLAHARKNPTDYGRPCVLCQGCIADRAIMLEAKRNELEANDAIARIRNIPGGAL